MRYVVDNCGLARMRTRAISITVVVVLVAIAAFNVQVCHTAVAQVCRLARRSRSRPGIPHRPHPQCTAIGAQCDGVNWDWYVAPCCNGGSCLSNGAVRPGYPSYCQGGGSASGDPHFVGLNGAKYEFQGASDMHFVLVTEPQSQLNAHFHNLGMGEATFIKALGLTHAPSGHSVTVDSNVEDCTAGAPAGKQGGTEIHQCTSFLTDLAMAIHVDGKPVALAALHHAEHKLGTKLLRDKGLHVYYRTHGNGTNKEEHVELRTARVMYTVHRTAGSCHLDLDMALLTGAFVGYARMHAMHPTTCSTPHQHREHSGLMHGVLGQTARLLGERGAATLHFDEGMFLESGLLSADSSASLLGTADFEDDAKPVHSRGRSMMQELPLAVASMHWQ